MCATELRLLVEQTIELLIAAQLPRYLQLIFLLQFLLTAGFLGAEGLDDVQGRGLLKP